jgi:hypothetical protein
MYHKSITLAALSCTMLHTHTSMHAYTYNMHTYNTSGADVSQINHYGRTALHYAAMEGNFYASSILVNSGTFAVTLSVQVLREAHGPALCVDNNLHTIHTYIHTSYITYIHTYIHNTHWTGANVDAKDNTTVPDMVNGGIVKGATAAFHARSMKPNEWEKVVKLLELYSNEVSWGHTTK